MPDAVNPDRNSLVYVYPGDDGPADGDTIQFNATTGRWEAVQGGTSVPVACTFSGDMDLASIIADNYMAIVLGGTTAGAFTVAGAGSSELTAAAAAVFVIAGTVEWSTDQPVRLLISTTGTPYGGFTLDLPISPDSLKQDFSAVFAIGGTHGALRVDAFPLGSNPSAADVNIGGATVTKISDVPTLV